MFTKILIANRGEIACRVIATCRKMGISTVAVFSEADRTARHVRMADEAVCVGPAPVAESYLLTDKIIAAAKSTGAQAIHPGYGFLSENPEFVEVVESAGLSFIGPRADAIRAMGLKDAAKDLMEKANVPVVPGYHGDRQDAAFLAGEADQIGYPVMIKARAGGGGKGMRLVEDPADFETSLESAQREGQASFGDPAVLVEKFIQNPRHIEIQVFGDAHGNVVHLFERDCSLQRRHQKVIEEAPAPGMTAEVRAAMGKAAVDAAKAINYRGAGTVEFIVDGSGDLRTDGFWFMEMNTRLQVEHPVSEAVTGLDFVELQLRVAAGEPLPFEQDDLTLTGHSFEARVYAEDVPGGFLPAIGRLEHLQFPDGGAFNRGPVRIDSGVETGDEISPWYDPMIAKVITHGATREKALARLQHVLAETEVSGTVTNLGFLSALAKHEGFGAGQVDTGLIARDLDALTAPAETPNADAIAAVSFMQTNAEDPFAGFALWQPLAQDVSLLKEAEPVAARVTTLGGGNYRVELPDQTVEVKNSDGVWWVNGVKTVAKTVLKGDHLSVFWGGVQQYTRVDPLKQAAQAGGAGGDAVLAPMPGLVRHVAVKKGQAVSEGDRLVVLEAMKMEHSLTAPRDGVIEELTVVEGDQVGKDTLLIRLEAEDG
ncbi:acetyl-CoA carboxylase biotin carboxylase subunit [Actibacterium pelagium]|uniref:3-methylcrotonyl-CoA carboxylase subunit alpha n=1 Tax=Actibacterium pelagium TaxID=2029103 RepID=A0A917EJ57_9RHOB|nr:acetyl/propionyl/methylcrotonyl-CoA carboxylase subunit alpha [Actibacterium pelagium]GGE41882.1 3-methylcrotonyl-CoA carboxylase subunit alpha [Actibacterium pelagium]